MLLRIFAVIAFSFPLLAQQEPAPPPAAQPTGEKLAPYYPTPETIVERMLELGELKAGEKMFDLGSGDGRIVIMAAQKYHADATGVELDPRPRASSAAKIRQLGSAENGADHLRRHSEAELFLGESHHRVSAAGVEYQSEAGA